MPFRWKTLLTLLLPLVVLGGLFWLERSGREPTVPVEQWQRADFSTMPLGDLPAAWATPRGTIQVVEKDDRRMLSVQPEPMVEGRVLVPGVLPGGGTIRARMSGESAKRAAPRFAVGLANEQEFFLRYLPGEQRLELITPTSVQVNGKTVPEDRLLAQTPLERFPQPWLWLELHVTEAGNCEARCWPDGSERPAQPQLVHPTQRPAGLLRASLAISPFALKPVWVDRVEWR